ncbi:MAG: energy transducer TonB [Desulforhopalus sp.]
MKKYMVASIVIVMFASFAIQANSDDKQLELERRLEQLQSEVNEIRQSLESPRDNLESHYVSKVIAQVKNNWFFPDDLDVKSDDFLRVALTIGRDGTIIGQEIMKSSGHDRFNFYALECISKSSPLPVMPVEMDKEFIELELRFRPPQN